jgi:hypothetical protein
MVTRPLTIAQLQEALKACQAKTTETEATASKKLAEAADLVSRLKLAATSAADREIKANREAETLRQQNEALQAQLASRIEPKDDDQPAQIKKLTAQVDGLLAENQRLADALESAQKDNGTLFDRLDQSAEREKTAVADAVQASVKEQSAKTQVVEEKLRLGTERLAALAKQMESSGKLEVLAPDQVGHLMGGFLKQMETGMPTLRLAEGELKLKLGLARSNQQDGFVILPPNASAELRSSLHEISLRFDRAGISNLQSEPDPTA